MNKQLDSPALNQLALSRAAIASHLHGVTNGSESSRPFAKSTAGLGNDLLRHGMQAWWRNHPAHFATDLVTSQIKQFAKEHPFELLGIAVGVGAAAAVVKPSRWVSIGVGALAFTKSFDLTHLISSLMDTRSAGGNAADSAEKKNN